MRLFRFVVDMALFALPLAAPAAILWFYCALHFTWPTLVRLPQRLDRVRSPWNVRV